MEGANMSTTANASVITAPPNELGSLFHIEKNSKALAWTCAIVGSLALVMAAVTTIPLITGNERNSPFMVVGPLAGFVGLLALVGAMIGFKQARYIYHFHENAVRRLRGNEVVTLLFDQVEAVSRSAQTLTTPASRRRMKL